VSAVEQWVGLAVAVGLVLYLLVTLLLPERF
jgi:K+-transporting ATPase KdpF subunit